MFEEIIFCGSFTFFFSIVLSSLNIFGIIFNETFSISLPIIELLSFFSFEIALDIFIGVSLSIIFSSFFEIILIGASIFSFSLILLSFFALEILFLESSGISFPTATALTSLSLFELNFNEALSGSLPILISFFSIFEIVFFVTFDIIFGKASFSFSLLILTSPRSTFEIVFCKASTFSLFFFEFNIIACSLALVFSSFFIFFSVVSFLLFGLFTESFGEEFLFELVFLIIGFLIL